MLYMNLQIWEFITMGCQSTLRMTSLLLSILLSLFLKINNSLIDPRDECMDIFIQLRKKISNSKELTISIKEIYQSGL
jgi:hypothetical protein